MRLRARPRKRLEARDQRGQGITELVFLLPVLLVLLVGMVDFARLISTTISIEAAAREAADYGTLYPWQWQGDPGDPGSNFAKTVDDMQARVCLASHRLSDYVGPDNACTNPTMTYALDTSDAGVSASQCASVSRSATPCRARVTLTYVFHLITPLSFTLFGTEIGFPSTITIHRDSVFAISDFAVDGP